MKGFQIFTCTCTWTYVFSKQHKQVAGPFYNSLIDTQVTPCHVGRVMTYEQFSEDYRDCELKFRLEIGEIKR